MADTIADANAAIAHAEKGVEAAQHKLAEARDMLDRTLAERGWRRLLGGFSPGATPLYVNVLYPEATLTAAQVIQILQEQRTALSR